METSLIAACENFSSGKFNLVYDHFSEDIIWTFVGGALHSGKTKVVEQCDKFLRETAGVVFKNTNIIDGTDKLCITGYCTYQAEDNTEGRVDYCDIYVLSNDKIESITSYCIEAKP